MRLVTFENEPNRHRLGAVADGLVVDLNAAYRTLWRSAARAARVNLPSRPCRPRWWPSSKPASPR